MGKIKLFTIVLLVAALLVGGCASPAAPGETNPTNPPGQPTPDPATPEPEPTPTPSPPAPVPLVTQLPPVVTVGTQIGNRAIDFKLQTLDGQTVVLSDLRGKPVLINFWATWCPPCKFEMPFLQQIHDSWSDKGLVLLEVDIGENAATVAKFMADLNLSMTVPMDTDKKVAKDYGITAIPTSFLIDKDGIIRQKVIGAFPNALAIETELAKIMPK